MFLKVENPIGQVRCSQCYPSRPAGSNANPICPKLVLSGHNETPTMRHHLIVDQCVPGVLFFFKFHF
ncbi:unnamed protein product [Nesidiocoris tenuis]|uniref:Uncharacterized protein n=1 Tax=Nesidiocoris tenuis TaxID=355587 RepID=A0A6H5H7H8_9HEMI|nr:unnamed protein product [Nesidiocoris tenuis]